VNRIGEGRSHQKHGCDCCEYEVFHFPSAFAGK
jgi:hypothetical protein